MALKDLHLLKLVEVGDFVISLRSFQGGIEHARERGVISPAYTILYPNDVSAHGYFATLFKSRPFIDGLRLYVTGIRQGQNIDYARLSRSCLPLPPIEERKAISAYVNRINHRCARFIRNRRRLIEVLNEQKQAIINRAVTRGLDPDVPFKPSGIEWLGDIPAHWTCVPLKHVARVQTGITLGKNYRSQRLEERPYLRVANVQVGRVDLRQVKTVMVPPSEIPGSELRSGDVLMTEGGDIDKLGRGCVWRDEIEGCLHQNHIFAVRVSQDRIIPEYVVALMASRHGRIYFEITAKRTTNLASTNSTTLGAFPLILPPIEEQRRVLAEIENETAELEALLTKAAREIDLIHEYRTRLISDVVTGKVDVRHLAPPPGSEDLEETVEALEPLDDAPGELDEETFAGQVDL